jgi:transposase
VATFERGRDLAAWLGLVPKQATTGGKPKLLGINKRGNVYLRKMLIHGARAALPTLSKSATPLGKWLRARCQAGTDRLGSDPEWREVRHEGCDGAVAQGIGQVR